MVMNLKSLEILTPRVLSIESLRPLVAATYPGEAPAERRYGFPCVAHCSDGAEDREGWSTQAALLTLLPKHAGIWGTLFMGNVW